MTIRVENHPEFIRDPNTFAVLNTDIKAKQTVLMQRTITDRVKRLEEKMDDIGSKLDAILHHINR